MRFLIKAKTYKLFTALYIAPIFIYFVIHKLEIFYPLQFGTSHISYYRYPLALLIHFGVYFCWILAIGNLFSIKNGLVSGLIFKVGMYYNLLVLLVSVLFLTQLIFRLGFKLDSGLISFSRVFFNSISNHIQNIFNSFLIMVIFNFYAIFYVSKRIMVLKFDKWKTWFFIKMVLSILFLPIGVWYIQTQIKKVLNRIN
jgi:hypothetical protein